MQDAAGYISPLGLLGKKGKLLTTLRKIKDEFWQDAEYQGKTYWTDWNQFGMQEQLALKGHRGDFSGSGRMQR